jgi:hypothetical protein
MAFVEGKPRIYHLAREPDSRFHLSFASRIVDDFVAARAHDFNKVQQGLTPSRKRFNMNRLQSTEFHRFQQRLESGSGPGGRRFKSSLPDQSFQALKRHFWFSVYIEGVEIVDGRVFLNFLLDFQQDFPRELRKKFGERCWRVSNRGMPGERAVCRDARAPHERNLVLGREYDL